MLSAESHCCNAQHATSSSNFAAINMAATPHSCNRLRATCLSDNHGHNGSEAFSLIKLQSPGLKDKNRSTKFTAMNSVSFLSRYFMWTSRPTGPSKQLATHFCLHEPINQDRPHLCIDLALLRYIVWPLPPLDLWLSFLPKDELLTQKEPTSPRLEDSLYRQHVGVDVFDVLTDILGILRVNS